MSKRRAVVGDDAETWTQRRRISKGLAEPTCPESTHLLDSELADVLLDLNCSSQLPAYLVQRIAAAALKDAKACPAGHDAVHKLAAMGSAGEYPASVARDIDKALGMSGIDIIEPAMVKCWCLNRRLNPPGLTAVSLPMWYPHELMDCFFENYPDEFVERFLGSAAELERFWAAVKPGDPRFRGTAVFELADYQKRVMPLRMHGDSVPYGKGSLRSLDVVSVSSPLGSGSSLDKLFPCIIVPSALNVSKGPFNTKRPLFRRFVWSLRHAYLGVNPVADWNGHAWTDITDPTGRYRRLAGQPLFGGKFLGLLCMLGADHDYLSNSLRLRHFNSIECCFGCHAEAADNELAMTNVNDDAPWRGTVESDHTFKVENEAKHIIWALVTFGMIILDLMHILDLGVLQYFLASALLYMYRSYPFRGNAEQKMELFWAMAVLVYKELKVSDASRLPYNKFIKVLETGNANEFPYLGGKAAVTRRFVSCLRLMLSKMSSSLIGHRFHHIEICLEAIERMYEIMFQHTWSLGADATVAQACVRRFCLHQNVLCSEAINDGEFYFQVTIKTHMLQHSAMHFEYYNPRMFWCYPDEDLMGRIAALASGVVKGTAILNLSTAIFARYRKRIYIKLLRQKRKRAQLQSVLGPGELVW